MEIWLVVWGLPQTSILANKLLWRWLKPHGYYECVNTPELWQQANHLITFSLVVDNFGIKYVGKEHADYLINCLKEKHKLTEDWNSNLLWYHTQMGLQSKNFGHFHAWIH